MTSSDLEQFQWSKGLWLHEWFTDTTHKCAPQSSSPLQLPAIAERLHRWLTCPPTVTLQFLETYASWHGYGREALLSAVSVEVSENVQTPEWAATWIADESTFRANNHQMILEALQIPANAAVSLFHPSLVKALDELTHRLAGLSDVDCTSVLQSAFRWVVTELNNLVSRTIALEANICRLQREDEPSAQSGPQYLEQLATDINLRKHFANTYPVLVRLGMVRVRQWKAYVSEVLAHYYADRPEIVAEGLVSRSETLVGLDLGNGDSHAGGRSVAIVVPCRRRRLRREPTHSSAWSSPQRRHSAPPCATHRKAVGRVGSLLPERGQAPAITTLRRLAPCFRSEAVRLRSHRAAFARKPLVMAAPLGTRHHGC